MNLLLCCRGKTLVWNPTVNILRASLTGTDIAKVNNMGQYVSVDGRPLSTNTGVGQDITKIFKSYIRAAVSKIETQSKVTDPFCYLQLKCPKGAYDVNIEPGKDDVLFSDRDLVISLIERLFTEHYGPLADGQKTSLTAQKAVSLSKPHGDGGFELLLSRRRSEEPSMQTLSVRNDSTDAMPANPISHRVPASSVSLSPESSHSHSTGNDSSTANGGSESRGSRYLNPWSISRINASFQTPQRPRAIHSSSQSTTTNSPEVTGRQGPSRHPGRRPSQDSPELPSPPVSSLTPGSPVSRRGPLQVSRGSPPEINQSVNSSRRAARERDRERYGNGALDTWFQRTTGAWLSQGPVEAPSGQEVNVPSLSQLAQQRFQPDPQGQAAGVRAETEAHEDSGGSMEDEIPPPSSRVEINIDSSHDERQEAMDSGRGFPVLEKWAASLHRDFDSANQTDLERTLDFERRKKEANQRQRTRSGACDAQLNPQNDPPAASSPHHNRYLSAKAILNAERPLVIEPDSRPALSPHDPRACLMRHQSDHQAGEASKNIGTVRRLHTSKLPFERVPEGQDLHDTCLPLSADLSLISTSFNLTAIHDSYTRRGTETDGFSVSDMESVVSSWNQHLAAIIQKQYKTKGQSTSPELQVDIAPVISRHAAQFNTS